MSSAEMSPDPPPQESQAPQEIQTPQETQNQLDPEEFDMLDARLDDLNTVLDAMEMKNDRIHAEFAKLLQSNKEIREELKKEIGPSRNHGNKS
ncbi:uncharacterized protein LOC143910094 [Arctopsyche grandis]|uniref:uncharacterized protein LOC143910094 n=1 Tax=Arctopsyche grandis TaxID=121162 RepID=UPI00406D822B